MSGAWDEVKAVDGDTDERPLPAGRCESCGAELDGGLVCPECDNPVFPDV